MTPEPHSSRGHRERGVSYIETLCGVVVLSIALLGHAASAVTEQQLSEAGQARSEVLHATRQFVERLRADEDFAGLLARIRSVSGGAVISAKSELNDGRHAYAPSAYYPDFVLPRELNSMAVRVDVPQQVGGVVALQEDQMLPFFGLPGDLNGDGKIDSDPRDDDYLALPVAFTFRWQPAGQPPAQMRLATWVRGRR